MSSSFEKIAACKGHWAGRYVLQDPTNNIADDSESSLSVVTVLFGRFVRMDYDWSYQGKPQEGSILIGRNPKSGEVTAHWIDTWHNGYGAMASTGADSDGDSLELRGSYPAPPGPDWGWRTVITPGAGSLDVLMYNVWPEGKEEIAAEMRYSVA